MKRRTMLLGLGTAAGGLAVGTGAFTSVTAERDVEVSVVEEDDAFLALDPLDNPGNGEYAEIDDDTGEFFLQLTETDEGGDGLNPEAVTAADDVFKVRNQGTEEIELTLTPDTPEAEGDDISGAPLFLDQNDLVDDSADTNQKVLLGVLPQGEVPTEPITIPVGESVTYGLVAAVSSNVNEEDVIDDDEIVFEAEVAE